MKGAWAKVHDLCADMSNMGTTEQNDKRYATYKSKYNSKENHHGNVSFTMQTVEFNSKNV